MGDLIFVLEVIGTIIFAFTGVTLAVEKKLDVLGAIVLGTATAVGGGMIRDIILGIIPANMFLNPIYTILAIVTSLIVFFVEYFNKDKSIKLNKKLLRWINILDAVGLGVFVIVGVNVAISEGYGENSFLVVFVGVITGVGGGVLRDLLAGIIPVILRTRVYAIAALIGATSYYFMYLNEISHAWCIVVSLFVTVAIRMLAIKYRWNLPRIK